MIQWNKSPSGKPSYFGSSLVLLALGPAGQIAVMHQELVEQKRWISEKIFTCTELLHVVTRS